MKTKNDDIRAPEEGQRVQGSKYDCNNQDAHAGRNNNVYNNSLSQKSWRNWSACSHFYLELVFRSLLALREKGEKKNTTLPECFTGYGAVNNNNWSTSSKIQSLG